MIKLDKEICTSFPESSSREWLETNGIGGYASGTVAGVNTRRYHGLLVAAVDPPLGRMVLLSKFDEIVSINGEKYEISCNQYPNAISPEGYQYLVGFDLDPFPKWTFDLGGVRLERSVFMVHGENTTVCEWKLLDEPSGDAELELKPLIAFRDHHHLAHENGEMTGDYQIEDAIVLVSPYTDLPTLWLAHNAFGLEKTGFWYRNFEYAIEMERGFDFAEDLFQPFSLRFDLAKPARVVTSTQPRHVGHVDVFRSAEMERRARLIVTAGSAGEMVAPLVLAADQFLVERGEGMTVIAGYPWFSDWGRDTMISLPGLTLATNRASIARSILTEFSKHISDGMLPNRFPDEGEVPEYNTVDATLWFFEAVRAYYAKTGDTKFVKNELYEWLVDIVGWHIRGTRYNIHVDTDGLLFAGEAGVQLTWMDAKIGDWVVTPRTGKPVEIQALWYNALCIVNDLATEFKDAKRQPRFFEMAEIAQDSFNGQFWNEELKCLYDVVNDEEKDASVRPNQIFAVSLPHTMLDAARSRAVVDKVEAELLTPVGLRSLSAQDRSYAPVYIGSPLNRDSSYHQGTVWGWLIGPFVDAYRRVHSKDAVAARRVESMIEGFRSHLSDATLGQVAEIFDGDSPHKPRGCGAQAWSVAELLRISLSDQAEK